jgi:lysophospholipase L1-like esterase
MRRFKSILFPLFAICAGLAIALVFSELSIRLIGIAPPLENQYGENVPDPYLPFKPKPHSRGEGLAGSEEYRFNHQHNSMGFRDDEHVLEKSDDVFRILGLGDSFTYGIGAHFEDTYLRRLEVMLNAREGAHPRVEIIKAGIPRYFAEPEKLLLKHYGLNYQPDLVTVGFLPNDIIDTYLGMDAVRVHKSGFLVRRDAGEMGQFGTWLFTRSHFFRWSLRIYLEALKQGDSKPSWPDVWIPNGTHESDWVALENQYEEMSQMIKAQGGQLLLIQIPQKGPWTEADLYPGKRLSQWTQSKGVAFVDTLPRFVKAAKAGSEPLYYPKDGHCTPAGYGVIADALFEYLVSNDLVP